MRKLIYLLFIGIVISLSSCRKDFETVASDGKLGFSKDTVYLDTVFTNIGSSTYTLKVYNRSNKDINIPKIRLGRSNSKYRMMIDGLTGEDEDGNGVGDGKVFNNVELLAKDSMYVFIETTASIADANPTDFLYTDDILFDNGARQQVVNLVTLIQDAIFLYPKRDASGVKETLNLGVDSEGQPVNINGFELDENDPTNGNELHFTKTKPYVIYGYAGVPNNKTLTIDPGAKVYFHAESGIVVQPGGSLQINGGISSNPNLPQENEVTFEGDRLEPLYEDVPGQWGTIWLRQGSVNNRIEHLTLKNSTVGLLVENCPLNIYSSQIYNSANYGILSRASGIYGENLVINLAGQSALQCNIGGSYEFRHCTFNNNWVSSNQFAVSLSNCERNSDGSIANQANLAQANFYNCIIYGSNNVELFLDDVDRDTSGGPDTGILLNTDFKNCLVKFRDYGTSLYTNHPEYNPIREGNSNGNKINSDPKFYKVNSNKLNIEGDSPAAGIGSIAYLVGVDVIGKPRTSNPPDAGAYQSAAFPE